MTNTWQDKDAIRELLAVYCFHLDAGLHAEMAALFTDDGVWDTAFGTGTGRDGIIAQLETIAALAPGPRPRRVHLTTNNVIALDGDAATVRSNWTVIENSESGPRISSGGEYRDRVVRQDGHWLFSFRKIDRDKPVENVTRTVGRRQPSSRAPPSRSCSIGASRPSPSTRS